MNVAPALLLFSLAAGQAETGAPRDFDAEAAKRCFEARCSVCHAPSRPLKKRKDRGGWEKTIRRMKTYPGATVSDPESMAILEYLSRICPPNP